MGYLKLMRQLRDHWIYKDSQYLHIWLEMLFCARYSEEPHKELIGGQIVEVGYGEFIFGRKSWSEKLNVSEQRLRTFIKKLIEEDMIEMKAKFSKCTVYKVKNYHKFNHHSNHQANHQQSQLYQGFEGDDNHLYNREPTINQPPSNHHLTTKEERNKVNNNNNNYIYYKEPEKKNPFQLFEEEGFGTINSVVADKLGDFIDTYGERWTIEAMKIAVIRGVRNLAYVRSILENWKANGIDNPWGKEREKRAKFKGRNEGVRPGQDTKDGGRSKKEFFYTKSEWDMPAEEIEKILAEM